MRQKEEKNIHCFSFPHIHQTPMRKDKEGHIKCDIQYYLEHFATLIEQNILKDYNQGKA